jgi:hypothetical protein
MLTEIAMTPEVFDQKSNPDVASWIDCLNALGANLFPRTAACPAMISNLQGGAWMEEVRNRLKNAADHRVIDRLQRILKIIEEILVTRPQANGWPDSEVEWVLEAAESHKLEPIGRVLMTQALLGQVHANGAPLGTIRDVDTASFWDGITSSCDVVMDVGAQVRLLRPICVHADYIALKLPYARGGGDETEFAAGVVRSAYSRPAGFTAPIIELHLNGMDHITQPQRLVSAVTACLDAGALRGKTIEVVVWRQFLDRIMIAGMTKEEPDGTKRQYPRWGVRFSHIAHPNDRRQPTGWNLVRRHDLAILCQRFDRNHPDVFHKETVVL